MSTIIETELKEFLTKLDSKIDQLDGKIDSKIDQLDSKIDQLERKLDNKIDQLERKLDNKIDRLDDKFDKMNNELNQFKVSVAKLGEGQNGINKRLDNLDFIARTVIGGVVLALITGLAKLLYPNLIS